MYKVQTLSKIDEASKRIMKQSSVEGSTMQSTIEGIATQSDARNRNVTFYGTNYNVDLYIIEQIVTSHKSIPRVKCIR